ncbi:hypothetical protein SAMN05444351_0379 [Geodermatophilus nigrescens]|uniref:Uncharacterized protein n=1 Tax=Geodermatophilus nigrescens TaxID=1070870 RepID=A0A1M5DHS6_9ACTN|nr:hypothetical protein SAMN05444351_0379 [Geodermatophilus nigrescens]
MTSSAVLLLLFLLALGALSVTTLVVAVRGGRGPADPPRSHPRLDPAGFPVTSGARGALHGRGPLTRPQPRRAALLATARAAAASHTARDRRTARPTSLLSGARPSPSTGRSSTRLP